MDAYTTDGHAMVGQMPGTSNVWLLGGFSGHGFKMASGSSTGLGHPSVREPRALRPRSCEPVRLHATL